MGLTGTLTGCAGTRPALRLEHLSQDPPQISPEDFDRYMREYCKKKFPLTISKPEEYGLDNVKFKLIQSNDAPLSRALYLDLPCPEVAEIEFNTRQISKSIKSSGINRVRFLDGLIADELIEVRFANLRRKPDCDKLNYQFCNEVASTATRLRIWYPNKTNHAIIELAYQESLKEFLDKDEINAQGKQGIQKLEHTLGSPFYEYVKDTMLEFTRDYQDQSS